MLEKVKLHSSTLQNVNADKVIECIETFISTMKDETLFRILKSSGIRQIASITSAYGNLLSCVECLNPSVTGYPNLCLKLIRMGLMIHSVIRTCVGLAKQRSDTKHGTDRAFVLKL